MDKKLLIPLGFSLLALLGACNRSDQPYSHPRSEFIQVYETSADNPIDAIQVPFDGVQDGKIHILSNLPEGQQLDYRYLVNPTGGTANNWLTIKEVDNTDPSHIVITYDAASLLEKNSLERRSGSLSFTCPELSLGKFVPIRQGYSLVYTDDFKQEDGAPISLTGEETFTTDKYPKVNVDYCDYISFNAWAKDESEFVLSKNITLDVTISGGHFYPTDVSTYRVNVPLGAAASKANLVYLLVVGDGTRMSADTQFTFSVANDDGVRVFIKNFAIYRVTAAEMLDLIGDEDFEYEPEWE